MAFVSETSASSWVIPTPDPSQVLFHVVIDRVEQRSWKHLVLYKWSDKCRLRRMSIFCVYFELYEILFIFKPPKNSFRRATLVANVLKGKELNFV